MSIGSEAKPVITKGTTTNYGTQNTVAVATSPVIILAANSRRKGFIIFNQGGADCYLGLNGSVVSGSSAVTNGGILLRIYASFIIDTVGGYTGPIYGVAASATVIAAVEWS